VFFIMVCVTHKPLGFLNHHNMLKKAMFWVMAFVDLSIKKCL